MPILSFNNMTFLSCAETSFSGCLPVVIDLAALIFWQFAETHIPYLQMKVFFLHVMTGVC